jgi:hypothetical protein
VAVILDAGTTDREHDHGGCARRFQSFQPFNAALRSKPCGGSGFKSSRKEQLDRNFQVSRIDGKRDRRRCLHWVFEAKKRLGLSVLNYTVTSNHVHLLVNDTGSDVIAQSMQLIAGRTAQVYNQRKGR